MESGFSLDFLYGLVDHLSSVQCDMLFLGLFLSLCKILYF